MKKSLWIMAMLFTLKSTFGQTVVTDSRHLVTVNENEVAREIALASHQSFLSQINDNLTTVSFNVSSVVIAEDLIYKSLSNVNSALKNGLAIKNMASIVNDMVKYSSAIAALAQDDPVLLLFSETYIKEVRTRALAIVTETSGFILSEGGNVLMDFEKRDKLMQDITSQLRIMDGLTYSAWSAMYWAKQKGLFKSLNPWQNFIVQDRAMVSNIISNTKYLRQ